MYLLIRFLIKFLKHPHIQFIREWKDVVVARGFGCEFLVECYSGRVEE